MFNKQYVFKCLTGIQYEIEELSVLTHYIKSTEPHMETLVPYLHNVCTYNNLIDTVTAVPVGDLYRYDNGLEVPVTPVLHIILTYSIVIAFLLRLTKQTAVFTPQLQEDPPMYGYSRDYLIRLCK